MRKNVLLVLAGMIAACATGVGTKVVMGDSFPPSATAHRWQQFCADDVNHESVNLHVKSMGEKGWELVSVTTIAQSYGMTVCYKRPE